MYPGAMEIKHDAKVQGDASKNRKCIHEGPVRSIQANLSGKQRKTDRSFGECGRGVGWEEDLRILKMEFGNSGMIWFE